MLIAIRLVRDGTADRRKVVLKPEAVMHPGPNTIKCTHGDSVGDGEDEADDKQLRRGL